MTLTPPPFPCPKHVLPEDFAVRPNIDARYFTLPYNIGGDPIGMMLATLRRRLTAVGLADDPFVKWLAEMPEDGLATTLYVEGDDVTVAGYIGPAREGSYKDVVEAWEAAKKQAKEINEANLPRVRAWDCYNAAVRQQKEYEYMLEKVP